MCLDTVYKEIKVKEGIGWKEFGYIDNGWAESLFQGGCLRVGKWIRDKNTTPIRVKNDSDYPAGFHLYKENSGEWHRRCVQFRDVGATGQQFNEDIIVAREIRVMTKKESKAEERR